MGYSRKSTKKFTWRVASLPGACGLDGGVLVLVVYLKIKKNVREISKNQCGCCVVLRNEISMGVRYAGARLVD